jgi:hypothetical protein
MRRAQEPSKCNGQPCPGPQRMRIEVDVTNSMRPMAGTRTSAQQAAAARGEIPTIKVGRLLRVPIRAMERMLEAARKQSEAA